MINKENLLQKEGTTRENRVWIRIAAACNEKCLFCLDSEAQDGRLIPEDIVKNQIRDGFKIGYTNRVILSGGEASINPKFAQYIQYAKEIGYDRVQTVTNGNMFAVPNFTEKVLIAGLDEITFSLHGHTAKLHDALTATPGSFEKALRAIVYLRKYHPNIVLNIDIVVCKVNVDFLPEIVRFFMRLGIMEFDILQIIPFGRGFSKYRDQLFYDISQKIRPLQETWKFSRVPGMYLWTNRFPAEAFEGYEDLIQDPRKIKSETMGESYDMFDPFIRTHGIKKPECFGEACDVCFLKSYCHDFLSSKGKQIDILNQGNTIRGEEFPSDVYSKYGETAEAFQKFLNEKTYIPINIPHCLGGSGKYETYADMDPQYTLSDYTQKYITNLYRKKSLRCNDCRYQKECQGIHINFIRSYGLSILQPIIGKDSCIDGDQ